MSLREKFREKFRFEEKLRNSKILRVPVISSEKQNSINFYGLRRNLPSFVACIVELQSCYISYCVRRGTCINSLRGGAVQRKSGWNSARLSITLPATGDVRWNNSQLVF